MSVCEFVPTASKPVEDNFHMVAHLSDYSRLLFVAKEKCFASISCFYRRSRALEEEEALGWIEQAKCLSDRFGKLKTFVARAVGKELYDRVLFWVR